MRKVLLTTLLAVISFAMNAQFSSNADIDDHNRVTINKYPVNGYLEHLPADYYSNPTKKYPMIVMLHGQSERGNGTTQLWMAAKAGPSYEAEYNGKFCIDGECFIVISPQLAAGSWTASAQAGFWDYILNQRGLRYDPDRIYLTGLSLGGNGVWNWITSDYPGADKIAAATINAGWGNTGLAYKVNQRGTSTWGFHGTADPVIAYNNGKGMSDAVKNSSNPHGAEHRWTGFANQGHNIWWMTYRMDDYYVSPNPYRWMAGKRRQNQSGGGGSEPNQGPSVNAGADVTVNANTGSGSVTASASDPDGSVVSYRWTKISGPAVSMWSTNTATLGLSNFAATGGTYEFQITVTDNDGATASDRVRVIKETAPTGGGGTGGGSNSAPTVSAGPDVTIPASSGSGSIQASASDSDGSIASYKWTKISGPSVSMWSTNSSKLLLSNFSANGGTYVFRVTVTDNDGAQASDDVTLVKQVAGGGTSSSGNNAPTVSAGSDFTVPASSGSASIQSSASDSDGNIASYKWTKISGPSVSMWSTNSSKLLLSNFAASGGNYVFRITVTDNGGATAYDDVVVTKQVTGGSGSGTGITVSAGADMTIDMYTGSALVQGAAVDQGGHIVKYQWTKVSGPSVSMWSTNSPNLGLSNFAASGGIYEFRLTVTDDSGNQASDVMRLTKLTTLSALNNNNFNYTINKESGEFSRVEQEVEVKNYRTDGNPVEFSSTQPMRVIIMGINGVMVTDEKVNGSVNANMLSNGMYIYRLVTEEGVLVQKGRIIRY